MHALCSDPLAGMSEECSVKSLRSNHSRRAFICLLAALAAVPMSSLARADPAPARSSTSDTAAKQGIDFLQHGEFRKALEILRPLADSGNAVAQFGLGFMYEKGYGIAKDDAQAFAWYRKAAAQGAVYAQFNLGYMYDLLRALMATGVEV